MRNLLKKDHSLAEHTSWKIGGKSEYFYQPKDLNDLAFFLRDWKENESILFLGAGSNVLIRDGGIKGLVIYLKDVLNDFHKVSDDVVKVGAGLTLGSLVSKTLDLGFVSQVFLAGIPGTVGGALAMNAGAHGDSIWEHVLSVETIDRNGNIRSRNASEFSYGYRHISGLKKNEWFVSAHLRFTKGDVKEAERKMQELLAKRRTSQPLDEPNCGSVFRNPENNYAACLIEQCGLKGYRIGMAEVSTKHANFILNKGNAKAKDVEALIKFIIEKVYRTSGVRLSPEVCILGDE